LLCVPVKTPERIKGGHVFLAGIVVSAISAFFGLVVLIVIDENPLLMPLSALVSVPLVAVFWRSHSTESTKPRGGHFAYLVLIAICASLASVYGVMGSVIGVVVIGTIVGAILSVPYAAYVGYINKKNSESKWLDNRREGNYS
jgi:O-antigen/teichoic acid export membrane protein